MSELAKTHRDQLERIKRNIENAHMWFEDNYKRYNDFRNMVFVSTMTDNELSLLTTLKKAKVEFNILEAYISRLRGEFSKNEPSVTVSAKDGKEVDPKLIEVIEGHLRHILKEANKDGLEYHCYTDTLSGGFSSIKVFTEYTGEMSFHQDIFMKRVFDPTLTGFDPLAIKEDKSDGEYCFEIFPKRREDFQKEYPELKLDGMSFKRGMANMANKNLGPFNWSYKTNKDEILLVADYYEKKKIKKTIMLLADGQVMTKQEYDKYVSDWIAEGKIAQPPAIVGKPRKTEITKIVRYKVIENQIFDYEETDYKSLPLIFVDGNSVLSKENGTGTARQFTRPYIYHAAGAQRLKNFCGQTLATEIENMGPSKMIAALDSIPPQYLDNYVNPQETIVYIYNAFKNGDPNIPLPPPQMMPRPPIPPEISNAFIGADAIVQNVLGSFDATMTKLTEQQVSGIAIQESATLSNAAAMPYVVSFLRALQSGAQRVVDLLPLCYKTPRTIPVIDSTGKKSYVKINQDGGVSMDYDHDAIEVSVEAGVSFNVQQSRALQQIIALMNSSPLFAQFINEAGIDIVLDNVEIRNVETLRQRAEQWMTQQLEMKKQAMESAKNQPNIEQQAIQVAAQQVQSETQIGMSKIQMQAAAEQAKAQLKYAELEMEKEKIQVELVKIMADIQNDRNKLGIEQQKANDKRMESLIDASIRASEHQHDVADKQLDKAIRSLQAVSEHEARESEADEAMEDIAKGE